MKYVSSFRNFPPLVFDTVTTEWAHTLHTPVTTHKEPAKNNYSQNKLLGFAQLQQILEKSILTPELSKSKLSCRCTRINLKTYASQ